MNKNFLKLNCNQLEIIIIGPNSRLPSIQDLSLCISDATVHGLPVIRTDQPSWFGTQVIRVKWGLIFLLWPAEL